MLKNYLLIALRVVRKNKAFSLINLDRYQMVVTAVIVK
jgi:hypothetical protein